MSNESQYGYINILNEEEVKKTLDIIESLYDQWIPRGEGSYVYHTLGSVSHIDRLPDGQINKDNIDFFNKHNKILKNNFQYLYDIIIKKVNEMFGQCEITDDVPSPGFYIYGGKRKESIPEKSPHGDFGGYTDIHADGLFLMLDYKWQEYGGATDSFGMTLSLEVPSSGTGILIWDQPDIGLYSNNDYAKRSKLFDFSKNTRNIEVLRDNIKNPVPEFIEYKPGNAFWQHGGVYHAVGYPIDTLTTDRRITMQIFGVKCDGIWRLIF